MIEQLIGFAGNMQNSLMDSAQSIYNTERTIRGQKELAEYAYTKDLEMWNRANAYNAPTAQMQRLKDAGLNPNLVYGSGSVAGNTSTQTPKYQMYDTSYRYKAPTMPGALEVLGQFQDYQFRKAQAEGARLDNVEKTYRNSVMDQIWQEKKDKLVMQNAELWERTSRSSKRETLQLMDLENRVKSMFPQTLLHTQAQIANLRENTITKQLENEMLKKGFSKSDWIGWRLGVDAGIKLKEWLPRFQPMYKTDPYRQNYNPYLPKY